MGYNYIPKYIRQSENKSPKSVVTASRWNELFNLLIQQGDHTAEELGNILNYFSTRLVDVESEISESAEAIANIREVFRINVTYSNGVYSADKTFAEIKAAYEAGQQPYVVYDGNTIYTLSYCYFASEQMFMNFERYLIGEDTLKTETLRIYSYTTASGSNIVKRTSSFDVPSGTSDHSQLTNRDAANQHPITAITGLQTALDGKADVADIPSLEGYATEAYVQNYHDNTKQDTITDLVTIRSGASKGATAIQPEAGKGLFSGSYNDLTDKPSIPDAVTEGTVSGWGFTKNTGTYSKPTGGIPKADLAAAVQTSLGKADTALQSHQSLTAYRTAAAQDEIDSGKVDKVDGKGLSTNDYTAAAKAKVDAIPANPKYTDTVYDDTALKERVATIEGKESAWDAKSDFSGSYNDLTDKPIVPAGALILYGTVGDNNSITFEPLPNGQNPYSAATAAYVGGRLVQIDVTNTAGDYNTILTLSRVSMGVLQFFNYEETEYYEEKRIQLVKMFSDDSATYSYIKVPTKTSQLTNDSGYLTLATLPKYGGESE